MKQTKLSLLLYAFILLLMTTSCNLDKQQQSGIRAENLDTTVRPQDDFYQYACGGWMKNNPLTAEYARYGSFDEVRENNQVQLKSLIEEIAATSHATGTVEQKIADLFNIAMDSTLLDSNGTTPIADDLLRIDKATTREELKALIPTFHTKGYDVFFHFYVDADQTNSDKYLVQSYQSGISLGQRDYYLEESATSQEIRQKYLTHIARMFRLVGTPATDAATYATVIMKIEKALAQSAYDNVKLRNPRENYNKMAFDTFAKAYTAIDWKAYFDNVNVPNLDTISVSQKENFAQAMHLLETEKLENLKTYFKWKVIDTAAPFLTNEMNRANFEFYEMVLSGVEQQRPRWKRAVATVDGSLGEAVGQMYVKKYFPPIAKERMLKLVKNLQVALQDRIENLSWMSDTTKTKAIEKLHTFHVKIGYPDTWRDYTDLDIKKDSYWDNIARVNQFETQYMFDKVGKPVDKDEWLMSPQTVNAYYNPSTNEICFPAGILQYPFFDMNADDAFNYGAIGVVIGHEMTHGFDDQGSQFDKDGNLNNWWTETDKQNFEARTTVLADYFDQIEVAPNVFANGRFTLGENIADYGGVQISYQAFQQAMKEQPLTVVDGFTPEQRFFLAYANVWAGNVRPEEVLKRTKTDPHSLGEWRVNGILPHIDVWYEVFDVQPTDSLFIGKEKRAVIW